LKKEI